MPNCKTANCTNPSVFNSEECWDHIKDKEKYKEKLTAFIKSGKSLKGANLSRVNLNNLELTRADFKGANLSRADLSDTNLFDANLRNAELVGADLSNSDLTSADLHGADLTRCCMVQARLWHANLENTTLIEANLSRADLWNTKLFNARFWRTDLSNAVSLGKDNFRSKQHGKYTSVYRINEKGILSSEEAYRNLKKQFLSSGRYDDASWASFKEKTMQKILLKKRKSIAYLPSLIMDLLCGYGEKPQRIIFSSAFVILFYATVYLLLNAIIYASSAAYKMSVGDYIYYSVITFTTVGYGDFIPKAAPTFRFLAASEAFIGTFMIGLFIFTLARKYSAR